MDIQNAISQFLNYSRYIKGYSKSTIKRYRQGTKYFAKIAGIIKVEEVTEDKLRSFFYYGRMERNWDTITYLTYRKSLIVFFRWCKQEGVLSNNPVEAIEKPKTEKKLPPKLTRQEALRLLEVVYNYPYDYRFLRYRNHALFSMFVFAGLRKSELLNLKLQDVDIENLSIFIRQGKGSKDRVVPMSYTLAQTLEKYLTERKRLNKTCPEFFTSLNRNHGFTEIGLRRVVKQMGDASKLSFTIHRLRHTFATLMLEGGCDIYSLSRMLGHNDIKTTTIYLYASVEHLRSQIIKHPLNNIAA